jgi:Tfp pilus assembly protein PilF
LDSHPPENYFVTLRALSLANPPGRYTRQVGNLETFKFQVYVISNGDWELSVSANGKILSQHLFTFYSSAPEDIQINLLVNWKDESNWTTNHLRTISVQELYPRNPTNAALMDKERAAVESNHDKTAIGLLKMIVDNDPRDFEAWAEMGAVLFAQGKISESAQALERALELKPSCPLALLSYGKFLYINKRYEASIRIFTQLVSKYPEAAEAHRYIGEAYLRMQEPSKAEPELQRALQLDRNGQAEAHLSLAAIYDRAGQKDRAAREYERFLEVWPDYPGKSTLSQYIALNKKLDPDKVHRNLSMPVPERLDYLLFALMRGHTIEGLHEFTRIDPWFLNQLREIVELEKRLQGWFARCAPAGAAPGMQARGTVGSDDCGISYDSRRHACAGGTGPAAQVRTGPAAGLQASGYLCGRIRVLHSLPLFDL